MDMCTGLKELLEDKWQDGREEGRQELVAKKLKKGYSVSEIADMLEEDESVIAAIVKGLESVTS